MQNPNPSVIASAWTEKQAGNRGITVEQVGRRVYFRGNTWDIKNQLRRYGAHWDPDERAWWLSTTKYKRYKDKIDALVGWGSVPRATNKQLDFLEQLYRYLKRDYSYSELKNLPREEASKLINKLKKELEAQEARERANRPTDRQIAYALRLIRQIGPTDWIDTDYGSGPPPTREDLEKWTKRDVAALIDSLQRHVPYQRPGRSGPPATPAQITYAMKLLRNVAPHEWKATSFGQRGEPVPTRDDLAKWTRHDVSTLIDQLTNP